jgi:hypothetical protein
MTSSWTNPTVITQYPEPGAESVDVSWKDYEFFNLANPGSQRVGLNGTLLHIARSPKYDIMNKTYFVRATGFNFNNLPNQISGIEFRFTADRAGRITDDTIQLCLGEELIGVNKANLILDPIKIYGSDSDMWENESLIIENITDPSFGIVIRLKSHPQWPHKDTAFLTALELRIH